MKKNIKSHKVSRAVAKPRGVIASGRHNNVVIDDFKILKDQDTNLGNKDQVKLKYLFSDGKIHWEKYFLYLSQTSQLGKIFVNFFGELDEEMDLGDLIGQKCQVGVEHNEGKNGQIWVNVVEVKPMNTATSRFFEDDEDDNCVSEAI